MFWILVGQTKATILSAYRTAETNAMLARTMFGVAEHSQHIVGRALDIRVDSGLSEAMTKARAMQRGGVGWYPHSGFIHIDSGPVRNWTLDERGLDGLLVFDGQRLRMVGRAADGKNPDAARWRCMAASDGDRAARAAASARPRGIPRPHQKPAPHPVTAAPISLPTP